jgi:hypothetical protein
VTTNLLSLVANPARPTVKDGLVPAKSTVRGQDLRYSRIDNVGSAEVTYDGCNFSYSFMRRAYFRNAVFKKCKFIGCTFEDCNFRGAQFLECDFSYSRFENTYVDYQSIFFQLPKYPNVRREFARSLRINAQGLGDSDGLLKCFWYEMQQEQIFLKEAAEGSEDHYKTKYPGLKNRLKYRWLYIRHRLAGAVWGHGESPIRVVLTSVVIWAVITVLILFAGPHIGAPDFAVTPIQSINYAVKQAVFLMLNSPDEHYHADVTAAVLLKIAAALSGYTLFGLAVATITRRYVRR